MRLVLTYAAKENYAHNRMRVSVLFVVLVWMGIHPLMAQPGGSWPPGAGQAYTVLDRWEEGRPAVDRSSSDGFLPAFGGALLGATIGGGMGWLVSPVDVEELNPDCRRSTRDCEGEVHLGPIGVWLGGTLGAVAGARADMDSAAPLLAGVAGGFGSLIGLAALATASNGRGPWGLGGFVLGAAAGAAFGAAVVAPNTSRRGVLTIEAGRPQWHLPRPAIGPQRDRDGLRVRVVLLQARF
jgi:hypothetical protein